MTAATRTEALRVLVLDGLELRQLKKTGKLPKSE